MIMSDLKNIIENMHGGFMETKKLLQNLLITAGILFLCTLMSIVFNEMKIRTENIIMIYLIGVLLIVVETRSFIWGIASSLLGIVIFNYLFTRPTYSLEIDDPNYIITIIVFFIVSFITGSLIGKLQQHTQDAKRSAEQTAALYEISKSYLTISGMDMIIRHTLLALQQNERITCCVFYHNEPENPLQVYALHDDTTCSAQLASWCYDNVCDCGYGTAFYEEQSWTYYPLHHNSRVLGVYAILHDEHMKENKMMFINTLISEMVMAMERELLYIEQEEAIVEIEKEKLRNNLLRSISHDLRTPLTGIAGSAALILENFHTLSDEDTHRLAYNINSDAIWLNQLVENLLNMTRIQDGKLLIKKEKEVVDDIICEAVKRCEPRQEKHDVQVHLPQQVILVDMDARLIIQVLINFIDNACKHTQADSLIEITCVIENGEAIFEVSDNGDGIEEGILETLFDSFVTTKGDRSDSKRGIGLGLYICKAIIEAHNGTIYARNKCDGHGAIFGFTLPYEEIEHE